MTILERILYYLSGASIAYYIWKKLGGIEHYQCPICGIVFAGTPITCPNCESKLKWR